MNQSNEELILDAQRILDTLESSEKGFWQAAFLQEHYAGDGYYINSLICCIDIDYYQARLIEVITNEDLGVHYLAILATPNGDFLEWHPEVQGTFFDRSVSRLQSIHWFTDWTDGRAVIPGVVY